ncbi:squalene synthase [Candidatus Poribacteria bacterium]|nr:squalene synthase [Candidatus Poribacteria bacterium]
MHFWKKPSHKAAFEYSRKLIAHHSKSFYISARLLPIERRWATYALYGFCRYVDNLIDTPRQRTQAELLKEIDDIAIELQIASRTGESEHPIIRAFTVSANFFDIPIECALDLVSGVKMDLEHTHYETFDDLYPFCYRVAGVVGIMMTHILGQTNKNAFYYAEKLGIAMQLTNILRDIQEDKNMGRIYLPLDELELFGVTKEQIINEIMSPNLRNLMEFQVNRAEEYYEKSKSGVPMLQKESQFAVYSAINIYRKILQKITERDFNPFLGRVFVPNKQKLTILLQEIFRSKLIVVQGQSTTIQ